MSRFDNKLCPVCRAPFKEGADIVVCPICGTPHHRACYMQKNKCALEEYHAKGFVWNGRLPDEPDETNGDNPAGEQENANSENISSENDNSRNVDPHRAEYPQDTPLGNQESMFEELKQIDPGFGELLRRMRDTSRGEDGVSMRELTSYAVTSIAHYGQAFSAFRGNTDGKKHKVFFNFCSGLFAPVFQFYRKMDLFGLGLIFIMILPSLIMLTVTDISTSALMAITYVINIVNLVETVLLCLFGDYIYYKHCIRQIIKIRHEFGDNPQSEEYYAELCERGKPSMLRAVVGFLIMVLAVALLWALQGRM